MEQASDHITDMRRIRAVQAAKANALAFMEPEELPKMLPDFAKKQAVGKDGDIDPEAVVEKAEKIKEMDQSS